MIATMRYLSFLSGLLCFGLLILGWDLLTRFAMVSPVFLPSPGRTMSALWLGLSDGQMLGQWLATTVRMLAGWLGASVAGILLGAVIGSTPRVRRYIEPTLEFLRPLPASAVVPLAIALLGLTDQMIIVIIAFGALWPMLLSTSHGFANVHERLKEVSIVLEMRRVEFAYKIAFPAAAPDILSGMRFGISIALILTVVGEMITSQNGLGSAILLASRSYKAPELFAGIALLGITGYVSSEVLRRAEQRLLRWRG